MVYRAKSAEDEAVKIQAELCRLCFNDDVLIRDSIMAQEISDYKGCFTVHSDFGKFSAAYIERGGQETEGRRGRR